MTLRPPNAYFESTSGKSLFNVLEYELMAERADSLGRAGLKAEAALAKLAAATDETRETLMDEAAEHVYALFVQRELCGLRNGKEVVARYGVPGSVVARLGVVRRVPEKDGS